MTYRSEICPLSNRIVECARKRKADFSPVVEQVVICCCLGQLITKDKGCNGKDGILNAERIARDRWPPPIISQEPEF